MRIDINQRKIAIGNKYEIYNDQTPFRFARSRLFRFLSRIELSNDEGGMPLLTLKKRLTFFAISYDIEYTSGSSLEFRTVAFWRGHYRCVKGNSIYDIFSHRGRKHSVYRNGKQTAWWDQEAVTWFEGDNYRMVADDDCDIDLMISFCLIMDDATSNQSNRGAFSFNFGKIGPEARKFDPLWVPKKSAKELYL